MRNFVKKYLDRWSIGAIFAVIYAIWAAFSGNIPGQRFTRFFNWLIGSCIFAGVIFLVIYIFSRFFPQKKPSSFTLIALGIQLAILSHKMNKSQKDIDEIEVKLREMGRAGKDTGSLPDNASAEPPDQPVYWIDLIDQMQGPKFELFFIKLLQNSGYENVQSTGGSGDQGVDVLAEKDGIRYAIQCKRYSHALGNTPVQEVNAGRQHYGCHVGVVVTNNYFTAGAKELASSCKVLLWDREKLIEMLKANDWETVYR